MDKLNRQQLGSGNWGQSINANWGKIEAGFSQITASVDTLQRLIENNQFGVAFGGFLRLDKVVEESGTIVNLGQEAAKLGQIWVTRNAVPASELYTKNAEGQIEHTAAVLAYKVGDISTGEHTDIDVPVNRVFRIIGSWDPTTDWDPQGNWVTGIETIAISPYDETLTSGGLLVYTATQFTRLFWNSLIYRPNPVLKGTKIVFEPVEDNETGNVEVPYPSALCKSVAQQKQLSQLTENRVEITSLGQIAALGGTITDYVDVKFVTIDSNNGEFESFYSWYKIYQDSDTKKWYVEFDADMEGYWSENDYAIIMYYGDASTLEEIEQLNNGTGVADVQEVANNG